jgi:hypothetical protein
MNSAGDVGFAVLVVVFMLGTYALALSLESIIDQWSRLKREEWGPKYVTKQPPSHHDDESKLSLNALGSCWGFRRRRGNHGVEQNILNAA